MQTWILTTAAMHADPSALGPLEPKWLRNKKYRMDAEDVFLKSDTFRVQTAPFDKIRIEFRRSRRRLLKRHLLEAKKQRREIMIFKGVVFLSKVRRFGSRRLRLTK